VGQQIKFTPLNYSPSLALLAGTIVGLPSLLVWVFFSNAFTYWLVCGGGVLFAFISFFWGNSNKSNKILALTLLTLIPLGMIAPYAPAVQPSKGRLMISATQPSLFERGLKNLQVVGEVTSCVYSLNGWEKQNLFYTETCANTDKLFQFDFSSMKRTASNIDTKNLLTQKFLHADILDYFQIANIEPMDAEFSVRELSIKGDGMLSPNGEWIAIVARHIYGPEDVVVVKVQPDKPNNRNH